MVNAEKSTSQFEDINILEKKALLKYLKATILNDSLSSIARNNLDRQHLLMALVKLQAAVDYMEDGMKYTE